MEEKKKAPGNVHIWHEDPKVVGTITEALIGRLGGNWVAKRDKEPYYTVVREDHFDALLRTDSEFRKFIFDTGCSVGKSTLGKDPQEYTQPIAEYAQAREIAVPGADKKATPEKPAAAATVSPAAAKQPRGWGVGNLLASAGKLVQRVRSFFPGEMVRIRGTEGSPFIDAGVVKLLQRHIGKRRVVLRDKDIGDEYGENVGTVGVDVPKRAFEEQVVLRNAGGLREMLADGGYQIDDGKGVLPGNAYFTRAQAEVEQAPKGWRKPVAWMLEGVDWFNRSVSIAGRVGLAAVVGAIGFMHLVAIPWLKSLVNTTTPYQRSIDDMIDDAPNAADLDVTQPAVPEPAVEEEEVDKKPDKEAGKEQEKKPGEDAVDKTDESTPHTDKAVEGATERLGPAAGRGR